MVVLFVILKKVFLGKIRQKEEKNTKKGAKICINEIFFVPLPPECVII